MTEALAILLCLVVVVGCVAWFVDSRGTGSSDALLRNRRALSDDEFDGLFHDEGITADIPHLVRKVLALETGRNFAGARPEDRFYDDLAIVYAVEIVMHLEEQFKVQLHDSECEQVVTLGDLVRLVASKVQVA